MKIPVNIKNADFNIPCLLVLDLNEIGNGIGIYYKLILSFAVSF